MSEEEIKEGLIYSKTGFRLYRYLYGTSIELEGKFLPLEAQGWGNYEKYVIALTLDDKVQVKRVRDNWNGSGADIIAHCELSDDEAEKIREKIIHAENLDDFKKLLNHLLATC